MHSGITGSLDTYPAQIDRTNVMLLPKCINFKATASLKIALLLFYFFCYSQNFDVLGEQSHLSTLVKVQWALLGQFYPIVQKAT